MVIKIDRKILLKLLDLLPNLESLSLHSLEQSVGEEEFKKVSLAGSSETTSNAQKLMKVQEKSLKKLSIKNCDNSWLHNLKDLKNLRLEYFEFFLQQGESPTLDFLKHQTDLKTLLWTSYDISQENLSMISELENLEILELHSNMNESKKLNLCKLEKLKTLHIDGGVVDRIRFGVFNDLEELAAFFYGASVESIQEMKRITPNLKKITIFTGSSDTFNALLDNLENLEWVRITTEGVWKMSGKVYPKIKYLCSNTRTRYNPKLFPNLEYLCNGPVNHWTMEPLEVLESSLATLFDELKQLKQFYLKIFYDSDLDLESIFNCIRDHGKNVEEFKIEISYYRNIIMPGPKICKISDIVRYSRPGDCDLENMNFY
jgi:hypothetical protein